MVEKRFRTAKPVSCCPTISPQRETEKSAGRMTLYSELQALDAGRSARFNEMHGHTPGTGLLWTAVGRMQYVSDKDVG
jgi:hypothetical protein